jgi:hypothetical protein
MAMTIHAAPPSKRLTVWLSRDGDSIVLALNGSKEPMRFQGPVSGASGDSHWEALDQVLRSTGR